MIFQEALIHSLKTNGKKIAVSHGDRQLTYEALFDISNGITQFLIEKELPAETFIGINLTNRTDLIACIIGVVNARCVFVPVDGRLPTGRLSAMSEDLNLHYTIASRNDDLARLNSVVQGLEVFYIEDILAATTTRPDDALQYPDFQSNDSVYVYFTSGTTGRPKGIVGKNDSLLQFLQWEIAAFHIDTTFHVSQFITPYFDAFLRDIFVPLLAGGTTIIPPDDDDIFTPAKLTSWIDACQIQLIHCVPSLFRLINHDQLTPDNYKSLKYILLSGEKIVPSELVRWFDTFGNRIQLVNLYGATESTMIRSCYRISPKDVSLPKIPIGDPIADTEFVVADEALVPCDTLAAGELYIISKYLSKGYLNLPALSAEKFRVTKTEKLGEAIAFKTGDRARVLANGTIDLLGRDDRQVKIRGIRIELDEIEYVLGQSELVKNAIVTKHIDDRKNESLHAFVIATNRKIDAAAIEAYSREHLPDYMVPSVIKVIDKIPLLSNGKVDYHTLLKSDQQSVIVGPATPVETRLLAVWKELLGDKEISTDQSFHSLGGNSLSVMRLVGKIYSEFQTRIPLSEIFKNLTISKQARLIEMGRKEKGLEFKKAPAKPSYVLSSGQERVYYHYKLNPASTAFNISMAWELADTADEKKIENALMVLVERHESLRTTFENKEGQLQQIIHDAVVFVLEKISTEHGRIEHAVASFIRPFDLAIAPLIRGGIITARDKRILVVDIHHIVCDGMSQANLFEEFFALYSGGNLPPLIFQYKDYAVWENEFRRTEDYLSLRSHWLKHFDDAIPKLQFPTHYQGDVLHDQSGQNIYFQIEKNTMLPLLSFFKDQDVSVFSGLFTTFYLFLAKITGQDDAVVGINTSGRMHNELEKVVGMFTKTLPIRVRMNAHQHLGAFCKDIHNLLTESNSRQIYDLADIVRDLNKKSTQPVHDLIDVMFVYQNFQIDRTTIQNPVFSPYKLSHSAAKYPITLIVSEDSENFYFRLEYASILFDEDHAWQLVAVYKNLIFQLVSNTDVHLLSLFEDMETNEQSLEADIEFKF